MAMNTSHMYNCLFNDSRITFDSSQKLPFKRANLHSIYSFPDVKGGGVHAEWSGSEVLHGPVISASFLFYYNFIAVKPPLIRKAEKQ